MYVMQHESGCTCRLDGHFWDSLLSAQATWQLTSMLHHAAAQYLNDAVHGSASRRCQGIFPVGGMYGMYAYVLQLMSTACHAWHVIDVSNLSRALEVYTTVQKVSFMHCHESRLSA